MSSREALEIARGKGLDLVMVAAQAQPPVCRIIDNGRFKYETQKREKEGKKKTQDVKGIKMRPNIAENDMNTLLRHARKFLDEGDKVRVVCQFRMRELAHPEIGRAKLDRFATKLEDIAFIDKPPSLDGRQMIMVMSPKPGRVVKEKTKSDSDANTTLDKDGNIVLTADVDEEKTYANEEAAEIAAADQSPEPVAEATSETVNKKKKPERKVNKPKSEDYLADLLGENY